MNLKEDSLMELYREANERCCEKFKVDKFYTHENKLKTPYKKTEVYLRFSFLWFKKYSKVTKYFYPWVFEWVKDNRSWKMEIDPIIKEITNDKDSKIVNYITDIKKMEEVIIAGIAEGTKRSKINN